MRAPGFWDDQGRAQQVSTRYSRLRSRLEDYEQLASYLADLEALMEIADEECVADEVPEELAAEIEQVAKELASRLERLEAARKVRTGRRCCYACICAGRSRVASL